MKIDRKLLVLLCAVAIGIFLRMMLATYARYYADQMNYEAVANAMLQGKNFYKEMIPYNYTPIWAYMLTAFGYIRDITGIPHFMVDRGFLSLIDVLNAILIGLIAEKVRPGSQFVAFSCYILNPLAIYVVGYEGQFEALACLPILLAVYIGLRKGPSRWVWVFVTVAIIIKHDVLFLGYYVLVYIYKFRRAVWLMMITTCLFILTFVPFVSDGYDGIYHMVIRYAGIGNRVYGLGLVLPTSVTSAIFMVVMLILPLVSMYILKLDFVTGLVFITTGMFTFLYGVSENYFLIMIVIGCILRGRLFWAYVAEVSFGVYFPWLWFFPDYVSYWPLAVLWYNLELLVALLWFCGFFFAKRSRLTPVANDGSPDIVAA